MALPQIPQYVSNLTLNVAPFRFNQNYDITQAGEANTYNNIFCEATHLYGNDVIYIERELSQHENIFGEFLAARLAKGTPMRLFCEEITGTGWGGSGDMYSKFGLQVQDEATFYCPTLTFSQAKLDPDPLNEGGFLTFYPKVSDLIYYVNGKKLFEIMHIENEAQPGMYVFGNRNTYVMKCRTYTYDHESVDISLPKEIQALDSSQTIGAIDYDIISTEDTNLNNTFETLAPLVIDNTEIDPLRG